MGSSDIVYKGKAWKLGDNISTDHILPSRYMTQVEPDELAANCLAGIEEGYSKRVKSNDILVAGQNIGYGSSREQAPFALKYAGFSAVIAKSFARIFYRNCFNVGLPAIACPEFVGDLNDGDEAELDISQGTIRNMTLGKTYSFNKPPDFLLEYIKLGGLIPYLSRMMRVDTIDRAQS
jgi:3-isopropylmalate/(R)-2-methylmalate dehydratase small subunit